MLNGANCGDDGSKKLSRMFAYLIENKQTNSDDQLYPNFHLLDDNVNHFERMMPYWPCTEESKAANILRNMLTSYRRSMGTSQNQRHGENLDEMLDLSAPDPTAET